MKFFRLYNETLGYKMEQDLWSLKIDCADGLYNGIVLGFVMKLMGFIMKFWALKRTETSIYINVDFSCAVEL